jgi:thiol-disulfide isomerase/thioredoxin
MSGWLNTSSVARPSRTLGVRMRNIFQGVWRSRWITVATVLAVLLTACSSAVGSGVSNTDSSKDSNSGAGSGSSSDGGDVASDLPFTLYQGSEVLGEGNLTVGSLKGKPLVLNFWAGLCPPCRAEMPDLQEFYEENKDRVNLLGIDVGQFTGLGNQDSAKTLLEELNVTYPAGFTSDAGVMRDYKVLGMPTTVFIDSKGEVFRHWGGVLNNETLTRITNEMLEAETAALNY